MPGLEGSRREEIHRAVSSYGIPGAMLGFRQTSSKRATLPPRGYPILRVRVELSPQWEHRVSQLSGSASFYNYLGVKKKNTDRP
jgi:hypothetical protein